jgi:EAL domain-containing protein (putative c-di-GMP-specific phosphodiesterase class I)
LLLACEKSEFIPFFQPLIAATTGTISSVEVLVRWAHPTRGLLPPAAYLDTAAEIGVLRRIDEIVFSKLCEVLDDFDKSGVNIPTVAINTSAERLADSLLIHDIQRSGIDPTRLTIEILESVFIERMTDAFRWTLDQLDELGVTIAIDDFGTGHASIEGLVQIKPSILKIDRQFVQPVVESKTSAALVGSIISIGTSLGMRIVAEGVETEEHAVALSQMGCDYLQGYHFGKPMKAEDLCQLLQQNMGQFWPSQIAALHLTNP